jgi:EAL and modified HD-GYP domain-containing signal transduction protein
MAFKHTVLTRPYASWLPLASFIKMEMTEVSESTVEPLLRLAQKVSKARVVAEKVETAEQHERLLAMGVELFQGYWFTKPSLVQARVVAPAQAIIIQLINLVRKEADPVEIETLLKRDPTLSFNLLRFINSSGFGLSVEITSFRHAVMILGLRKLFRWAAMLLTASRAGGSPPAVGNLAVLRGRLMELLAAEMLPAEEWDNAFVVGVFSLLDVMLGMPIEKALETIALPQHVVDALVHRTGIFAPFLRIVEVCESGTDAEVAQAAEALALTNRQVNMAHLEAMAWTENLLAGNP